MRATKGIFVTILLSSTPSLQARTPLAQDDSLTREQAIEDVRQLVDMLEHIHPDPYLKGGGKIAFHRRFQEVLAGLPQEGLSVAELHARLAPFLAAMRDGHTFLFPLEDGAAQRAGLPFAFGCIEDSLYVRTVYDRAHAAQLGSRLVSVAGVPFEELLERFSRLKGTENEFHHLDSLRYPLWSAAELVRLVPECAGRERIEVELSDAQGEVHELDVPLERGSGGWVADSRLDLPSRRGSELAYAFLDEERQTALLRVSSMTGYREAFERRAGFGITPEEDERRAREIYRRYNGAAPPDDYWEVLAGVPSATEIFVELFSDMQEAGTRLLIVDLRDNSGGSSAMSRIFVYFLYGEDAVLSLDAGGYEVLKLSHYYFESHEKVTLRGLNEGRELPLVEDDYDFSDDLRPGSEEQRAKQLAEAKARHFETVESMPSFLDVYDQGTFEACYRPERVVVLCNAATFSAGFTMLVHLKQNGAVTVGTPSGQARDAFGSATRFQLAHSGVRGLISQMYFGSHSEGREDGSVLLPDHVLTYEKFASSEFDPNAELLWALELYGAPDEGTRDG